ncbi:hypothetical protein ACK1KB_08200 [Chryseobacterium sp. TY3]
MLQGAKHRNMNHTEKPAVFIEVQTGTYFGEDDILKVDEEAGRK